MKRQQYHTIPFMQLRGGSSRGLYFCDNNLPDDELQRNQILLDAIGRDATQVDGLGGGRQITSKVAIISPSKRPHTDVDYQFVQVVVGENRIDATPNCGNILSGVGPFAIESGMVAAQADVTTVNVYMCNSGSRCELVVQTPSGKVNYQGNAKVDGVLGTAAPVHCNYLDIAGSSCGALLPTGNARDVINGVPATCIDNGMPLVVMRAVELGKTGYESCEQLEGDSDFRNRLELIRLQAGELMNLGDVSDKVIPKMCLIAPPQATGHICTRTFIPHNCHSAIGVLAAVTVATACTLAGSVAESMTSVPDGKCKTIIAEHPSGEFTVSLYTDTKGNVYKAGVLRTARLLAKGELYV